MAEQVPFFQKTFVPTIKANSRDSERYKFLIYADGEVSERFSTHKITLFIEGSERDCYFAIAPNDWIYIFTDDNYNSELDGWHGDHFTLGYFTEEEIATVPEFKDIIKLHKTSYVLDSKSQKYLRNAQFCDFKFSEYTDSKSNPPCYYTKDTVAKLSKTFNPAFSKESRETMEMLRAFLQVGLEIYAGGKSGGKSKNTNQTFKYKNRRYKVHTGQRSGKYIIVNKKKIYIAQKGGWNYTEEIGKMIKGDVDFQGYKRALILVDTKEQKLKVVYDNVYENNINNTDELSTALVKVLDYSHLYNAKQPNMRQSSISRTLIAV
jgi:hypothetical protein